MTDQVNCKPDDFQEEDPNAPKFTPGPWMSRMSGMATIRCVENNREVATVFNFTDSRFFQEEDLANINLIKVAPEMYEMLSEIFEWIFHHDEWWVDSPGNGGFDSDRIRDLLAKARGQNPENK